jgi:hypothetical protein
MPWELLFIPLPIRRIGVGVVVHRSFSIALSLLIGQSRIFLSRSLLIKSIPKRFRKEFSKIGKTMDLKNEEQRR